MIKKISILLLVFFAASCTTKKQDIFKTKFKASSEVFVSNAATSDVGALLATANEIIVMNSRTSPLIEIYDAQSGEMYNSFLNVGNGPGEALAVGHFQLSKNQDYFTFFDVGKKELFKAVISEAKVDSIYIPEIIFSGNKAEETQISYNYMKLIGNQFFTDSKQDDGRFTLYDTITKTYTFYGEVPEKNLIDKNIPDDQVIEICKAFMESNLEGTRFGLVTLFGEMLDIYSNENGKIENIFSYHAKYPEGIGVSPMGERIFAAVTRNSIAHFPQSASTDNYLYALHSGRSLKDFRASMKGQEIYVVDWNGKETFKIELDQEVSCIAVSPDDKFIYGINKDMDLIKFTLHEI